MAHLNLSEQEQVAAVKYFWKDWGKYIALLVIVLILGYVGNSLYTWQQNKASQRAAQIYSDFKGAFSANQESKVYSLADKLIADEPKTEFAQMASLQAAKVAFTTKNYKLASSYLLWLKDHGKDKSLKSVAILRLASVYIDDKRFSEARELLRTKHDLAFDGLFYEGRGDMYVAMGDLMKARDAYKEGLQKAANDPSAQQSIQMKLDLIGN